MNKHEIKLFFRFLKERNIYYAFLRNFRDPKTRIPYDRNRHLMEFTKESFGDVINQTLWWNKTEEGHSFWKQINDEFHAYWYKNSRK